MFYKTPFLSIKLEPFIIFAHIPEMNSVTTLLNINNSNIIKTHSFLH